MFLELGDKTERGKERFLFFYIARCLIFFRIGMYVSDKTRNCCQIPAFLQGSYGIRYELAYR